MLAAEPCSRGSAGRTSRLPPWAPQPPATMAEFTMSYDQLHLRSGPTSTGGGSTGRTSQVCCQLDPNPERQRHCVLDRHALTSTGCAASTACSLAAGSRSTHKPCNKRVRWQAGVRASARHVVAAQVEWYETGGGSATYSAANEYAPYNPAAAQAGAEYGSFDDEPPLLEGVHLDKSRRSMLHVNTDRQAVQDDVALAGDCCQRRRSTHLLNARCPTPTRRPALKP